MLSFTTIIGAFVLLSSFAFADNLFAGCYSSLPGTVSPPVHGPAWRVSSDQCSVSLLLAPWLLPMTDTLGCLHDDHSLILQCYLAAMLLLQRNTILPESATRQPGCLWLELRQQEHQNIVHVPQSSMLLHTSCRYHGSEHQDIYWP
jgi:hypothetical protein